MVYHHRHRPHRRLAVVPITGVVVFTTVKNARHRSKRPLSLGRGAGIWLSAGDSAVATKTPVSLWSLRRSECAARQVA